MPDYREVTINVTFEDGMARIWCAKRTWEKLLVRRGWKPVRQQIGGVWYEVPMAAISIRSRQSVGAKRGNPGKNLPPRKAAGGVA